MNLEKELQGYANKKPDQVIEVIKSWLSEDER
jgi:flagellar M-ring protein FliF